MIVMIIMIFFFAHYKDNEDLKKKRIKEKFKKEFVS